MVAAYTRAPDTEQNDCAVDNARDNESRCVRHTQCMGSSRTRSVLSSASSDASVKALCTADKAAMMTTDTCSPYEIADGKCGQSDLNCDYVKYAKAVEKGLQDESAQVLIKTTRFFCFLFLIFAGHN